MKTKKRLPSNWRRRITITKCRIYDVTEYTVAFKRGKTPKGFMTQIGTLEVNNDYPHYCSVDIEEYFCRRGLGTLLYETALSDFGELSTTYHHASEEAKCLWKSLIREHRHETDFFRCILTIFKKAIRCKIEIGS